MAIIISSSGQVRSFDAVQRLGTTDGGVTVTRSSAIGGCCDGGLWGWSLDTYAAIYRTQPNVRICVDFLARGIAQLGFHIFRRVSDTDRQRLADHELAQWLNDPFPGVTRFRLFEALMSDWAIYGCAFWLKLREPGGRIGLLRLPPQQIEVLGVLVPMAFRWTMPTGEIVDLDRTSVVYFRNYNPENPVLGLSPIETLRQTLAQDAAASAYRESFWQNSARDESVITRPATAPKWNPDQRRQFREQWQERFAGTANAGNTPVLEDGMDLKGIGHTARDSEYTASRELTAEEVARAYHLPPPAVGLLKHATYSNITEQHKQLYQDTFAPICTDLGEEIEVQLLIECRDQEHVYGEFNLADKLKGSFEESLTVVVRGVGRPIMTANEGRARLNLPAITDDPTADQLVMPLNTAGPPAEEPEPELEKPPPPPQLPPAQPVEEDEDEKAKEAA